MEFSLVRQQLRSPLWEIVCGTRQGRTSGTEDMEHERVIMDPQHSF